LIVATIYLGDIAVEVVLKSIKNIHLSVYPPQGGVRIAAPLRMDLNTIRVFAASKISWIKQQRHKLQNQARESPRDYIDRESHYLWGKRYLLKVVEHDAAPKVTLKHSTIVLHVRHGADDVKKQSVLDEWYRQRMKEEVYLLLAKWVNLIGVDAPTFTVRKMKTKWGSCTPESKNMLLNLELAKKPTECLEYILVHELVHLLEPTHNSRFIALMSQFMPKWRLHRDSLNRLPVRHENWDY
jgi:predicted metal-dependent hydrolase